MSGALSERVFVDKMANAGFGEIDVVDRRPFGLADAARYPLFTPELIDVMVALVPPERQAELAVAVTVSARKPGLGAATPAGASRRQ